MEKKVIIWNKVHDLLRLNLLIIYSYFHHNTILFPQCHNNTMIIGYKNTTMRTTKTGQKIHIFFFCPYLSIAVSYRNFEIRTTEGDHTFSCIPYTFWALTDPNRYG